MGLPSRQRAFLKAVFGLALYATLVLALYAVLVVAVARVIFHQSTVF